MSEPKEMRSSDSKNAEALLWFPTFCCAARTANLRMQTFARRLKGLGEFPLVKAIAAIGIASGVFALFLKWYWIPTPLAWPSLLLARGGISHSWIASVILLIGGVAGLGFSARKRRWIRLITESLIFSAGYCVVGYRFVSHLHVPIPQRTPYDSMPAQRLIYLRSFESGYRDGMFGMMWSYCFLPEVETRGLSDGSCQGSIIWYRMLGQSVPPQIQRKLESSGTVP